MLLRSAQTALVAAALGLAALAAPEEPSAKTRAMTVGTRCTEDPTVPEPVHRLTCPIEGPGKFDVMAEASFSNGRPGAVARMSLSLDGQPCGQGEMARFTGRSVVYGSCSRRKLEGGPHTLTVGVDVQSADYGGVHVTVIQRDAVPRTPRPAAH
jgi:hypothetical protein